jgi:hypothetical protein
MRVWQSIKYVGCINGTMPEIIDSLWMKLWEKGGHTQFWHKLSCYYRKAAGARDLQENVTKWKHKTVSYRWNVFPSMRRKVNMLTPAVRQYRSEYSLTNCRRPGYVDLISSLNYAGCLSIIICDAVLIKSLVCGRLEYSTIWMVLH